MRSCGEHLNVGATAASGLDSIASSEGGIAGASAAQRGQAGS